MRTLILPLFLLLPLSFAALAETIPNQNQYATMIRVLREHAKEASQLTESIFQVTEEASFSGDEEMYYVDAIDSEIKKVMEIANTVALLSPSQEGSEGVVVSILEETRQLTAAREKLAKFLAENPGQSPAIGCQDALLEIQIAADRLAEPAAK